MGKQPPPPPPRYRNNEGIPFPNTAEVIREVLHGIANPVGNDLRQRALTRFQSERAARIKRNQQKQMRTWRKHVEGLPPAQQRSYLNKKAAKRVTNPHGSFPRDKWLGSSTWDPRLRNWVDTPATDPISTKLRKRLPGLISVPTVGQHPVFPIHDWSPALRKMIREWAGYWGLTAGGKPTEWAWTQAECALHSWDSGSPVHRWAVSVESSWEVDPDGIPKDLGTGMQSNHYISWWTDIHIQRKRQVDVARSWNLPQPNISIGYSTICDFLGVDKRR